MRFGYTGVRVKDMDESVRFYTEVMGMRLVARSRIPTTKGEVAALQSPGSEQMLELNHYEPDSPYATPYTPGEGLDHLAFKVDDAKKAFEELRAKGVEVALEPPQRHLAFLKDPNGIWIELYQ